MLHATHLLSNIPVHTSTLPPHLQSGGWGPSWRTGLIVGVTALALIISILVFLVLRSRSFAVTYLEQQKV